MRNLAVHNVKFPTPVGNGEAAPRRTSRKALHWKSFLTASLLARNWKEFIVGGSAVPIQIQHVLCPIDFSEGSRHALDYAVTLARWYRARLSVLHVYQLSTPVYGVSPIGSESLLPIALSETERRHLFDRLDAEVAGDRSATGLTIETCLDEAVNTPDAILAQAERSGADFIVMGTHGRSGFERLMLGSVAEKVLRRARCPVLTVPARTSDAVPRGISSLARILCPVDFSASSEQALQYAASLAGEAHAELTVLHVVELPPDLSDMPHPGMMEYRDRRFQQARTQLAHAVQHGVPASCKTHELVLVGKSYREILRVAEDQAADLIALGVKGRGAADLMFFGSTTNHVLRQATCPVLTLKGADAQ
jgi:nucleotide-binding universal stress UspA family protein